MPKSNTLVFGATGSLGGHVLDEFVTLGIAPETITAVGRNESRLAELATAGFGAAAIDLSDSASIAELVSRHSEIVLFSGTLSSSVMTEWQ